MSRGQGQPLSLWGWVIAPALLSMLAAVVLATPVRLFGLAAPEPVWPMVLAFAWPIIRPSLVTPFVLLGVGLFLDLFWGSGLGHWALSLLIAYGAALFTRHLMVGQSGAVLWAWYVGLTGLAFGASHLFTLLELHAAPSPAAVGLQAFVTALLYPLAHRLIDRFEDAGARVR